MLGYEREKFNSYLLNFTIVNSEAELYNGLYLQGCVNCTESTCTDTLSLYVQLYIITGDN